MKKTFLSTGIFFVVLLILKFLFYENVFSIRMFVELFIASGLFFLFQRFFRKKQKEEKPGG